MALTSGDRLGPYEILSSLGEGGMGEVWKARDTRLNRDVAIKVSKEQFSERFETEARAVAALNHPNICTLYDVGPNYLVMELIEGQPIAGPLPAGKAVQYACQILDALDAAHKKGVIHRDLKPGNILLNQAGQIKLLDFGLAKLRKVIAPTDATVRQAITHKGAILGTLQYMSPEQLNGKEADARSDIFSFGCVFYELLTGKRAFDGEGPASVIAAIMERDTAKLDVAPGLEYALGTCLAKNPNDRWQSARDLKRELLRSPGAEQIPQRQSRLPWAIAAAAVLAAGLSWIWPWTTSPPAKAKWKLSVILPKEAAPTSPGTQVANPEISPDGTTLLYRGRNGLFVRRLDSMSAQPVRGTEAAAEQFWSPDSKSVGFFSNNRVVKMRLPDGAWETVGTIDGPQRGGAWSDKGVIVWRGDSGSLIVSAGGRSKSLEVPGLGRGRAVWPEFLPGGDDLLFGFAREGAEAIDIYLAPFRSDNTIGAPLLLKKNTTAARYSPAGGGHLLFLQSDNLYAQKLDLKARKLEGEPELVTEEVASSPSSMNAHFSVSRNGVLAWRTGKSALGQVAVLDRQGETLALAGPPGLIFRIRLPSAGKRVFIEARPSSGWVEPNQSRLTPISCEGPGIPAHDGETILVLKDEKVVECSPSSSGAGRELADAPGIIRLHGLSPDGRILLAQSREYHLVSLRLDGPPAERKPNTVIASREQIYHATFSPDGKWILYSAYKDSEPAVFIQPFPGPGLRKQISTARATHPIWRDDGAEILYLDRDSVLSVRVASASGELRASAPQKLFQARTWRGIVRAGQPLAVSRDGSRIFMVVDTGTGDEASANVIHVASGWHR